MIFLELLSHVGIAKLNIINQLKTSLKQLFIGTRLFFGNIFQNKKTITNRIAGLQRMDPSRKNSYNYNLENELANEYNSILKDEEDFWKLKSRVQWLNDGDANTRFFHTTTIKRRRRNKIIALSDSMGNWSFNPPEINTMIINHFSSIYRTELLTSSHSFIIPQDNFLDHQTSALISRPL